MNHLVYNDEIKSYDFRPESGRIPVQNQFSGCVKTKLLLLMMKLQISKMIWSILILYTMMTQM